MWPCTLYSRQHFVMTLKLFRLCLFRSFSLDFFLCNYFLFSSLPFVHTRLFREIIWLSEMYYCNNLMTSNDRLGTYHKHSGVNSSKWSEHISLTVYLECGNQQTNRFVALHSFHIKICLFTVRTVYIKLLFRQKTSCHSGVICTFWFRYRLAIGYYSICKMNLVFLSLFSIFIQENRKFLIGKN